MEALERLTAQMREQVADTTERAIRSTLAGMISELEDHAANAEAYTSRIDLPGSPDALASLHYLKESTTRLRAICDTYRKVTNTQPTA